MTFRGAGNGMTVKRTVSWTGKTNATLRSREHLTEVKTLLKAARQNRHGHRDATLILMAHRHGLRAAELTNPRGDQVDFVIAH